MRKKVLALILSICMVISIGLTATAESSELPMQENSLTAIAYDDIGIQPLYDYMGSQFTTLNISGGQAECAVNVYGYNGITTKIVIKMTLQKKTLFWWSDKATWSKTVNSSNGALSATAPIDSGTYRVKGEITVYSGSQSETITTYSTEKKI